MKDQGWDEGRRMKDGMKGEGSLHRIRGRLVVVAGTLLAVGFVLMPGGAAAQRRGALGEPGAIRRATGAPAGAEWGSRGPTSGGERGSAGAEPPGSMMTGAPAAG